MNSHGASSTTIACACASNFICSAGSKVACALRQQVGAVLVAPVAPVVVGRREAIDRVVAEHRRRIGEAEADVDAVDAVRLRRGRRVADRHQHGAPFDHVEVDVHADGLEVLLHELVHRDRHHLTRSRRRDHDLRLHRLVRAVAGLLQQRLRLLRIVAVAVLRRAEDTGCPADTDRPPASRCRSASCTCPRDRPRS